MKRYCARVNYHRCANTNRIFVFGNREARDRFVDLTDGSLRRDGSGNTILARAVRTRDATRWPDYYGRPRRFSDDHWIIEHTDDTEGIEGCIGELLVSQERYYTADEVRFYK